MWESTKAFYQYNIHQGPMMEARFLSKAQYAWQEYASVWLLSERRCRILADTMSLGKVDFVCSWMIVYMCIMYS